MINLNNEITAVMRQGYNNRLEILDIVKSNIAKKGCFLSSELLLNNIDAKLQDYSDMLLNSYA